MKIILNYWLKEESQINAKLKEVTSNVWKLNWERNIKFFRICLRKAKRFNDVNYWL